jgi:hypothetical protein
VVLGQPLFMENDIADQHAIQMRQMIRSLAGERPGVVGHDHFLTAQTGGGALSVSVTRGGIVWEGTEATYQGFYYAWNDATVILPIATPDPANPRNDLVIVKSRDAFYSGADNDGQLTIIAGTPAASPVDPDLDALGHENYIKIARVRVTAADTAITSDQIDDLRQRSYMPPKYLICTSGTRPTLNSGDEGIMIYETDTNEVLLWIGTSWKYITPHIRVGSNDVVDAITASFVSRFTITLPEGTWSLDGHVRGGFSVSGARTFSGQIWNSSDSTIILELSTRIDDATSNNPAIVPLHSHVVLAATKNIQVRTKTSSTGGSQNNGGSYLRATRVREVI